MHTKKALAFASSAALLFAGSQIAHAQTVTLDKGVSVSGQGATFVSNFVEQCKADVKNAFGINIAYQPTGSGAGRSAFISGTNDFAGSDVPFTTAELARLKDKQFVYVPVTIGGIAIIYRLPGVAGLKLSGPTIAKIFAGSINKWNDDAIARENPKVTLPGDFIRVIVRSDSSGTSSVFTDYLASAGKGAWTKGVKSNFPVPAGNGIAQRGSDGVTNYVAGDQGKFAITYAETSFAEERKLSVAKVINAAGNGVAPAPANITEAMEAAAVNDDGTLLLNFNAPGANAYPVATTSYLIAPVSLAKAKGDVLRTFLTHSLGECQTKSVKVGYAPLPKNLVKLGNDAVAKINPGSGPVPTVPKSSATTALATTNAPTTKAASKTTTTKKSSKRTTSTTKKK